RAGAVQDHDATPDLIGEPQRVGKPVVDGDLARQHRGDRARAWHRGDHGMIAPDEPDGVRSCGPLRKYADIRATPGDAGRRPRRLAQRCCASPPASLPDIHRWSLSVSTYLRTEPLSHVYPQGTRVNERGHLEIGG